MAIASAYSFLPKKLKKSHTLMTKQLLHQTLTWQSTIILSMPNSQTHNDNAPALKPNQLQRNIEIPKNTHQKALKP